MKLRIRDNSLRFRLDRREIDTLAESGRVESACKFAPSVSLRYCVSTRVQDEALAADFTDGCISLWVRSEDAVRLASSGLVGLDSVQPVGDGGVLKLLLEKDFQCLTERPGEDDSNAFDNPLASHACPTP